jgi:hypothetical protein
MDGTTLLGPILVLGALLALGALIAALTLGGRVRLRGQQAPPHAPRDRHRVLVLLTTDCVDERVCDRIARRAGRPVEVRVAVPLLAGPLATLVTVDDRDAVVAARQRMEAALAALRAHGVPCSGVVGGPTADPVQLLEDELATWAPDELVLVIHPEAEQAWAEHGIEREAVVRFAMPLTVVRAFEPIGAGAGG